MSFSSLGFSVAFAMLSTQISQIIPHTQRPIPTQHFPINSTYSIVTHDLSINYEYISDTEVGVGLIPLLLIGIILPLCLILFVGLVIPCLNLKAKTPAGDDHILPSSSSNYEDDSLNVMNEVAPPPTVLTIKNDLLNILSCFFLAVGTTEAFTSSIKYYVGRLRPNFFSMCKFSDELMKCTETDEMLLSEARKSFPSGHSSLSFCAMTFVACCLQTKISEEIVQKKTWLGPIVIDGISLLLWCLPLALASYVAASRVHDNWHHPSDVVTGAVIGLTCALWCYSKLYIKKLQN